LIDAIVVGAGLAGAIVAEQLASKYSKNVLVVESRLNGGCHCYDKVDKSGIRLHMYGPHLFHTDNSKVWNYLSRFTDWDMYEHRVLAEICGKKFQYRSTLFLLKLSSLAQSPSA